MPYQKGLADKKPFDIYHDSKVQEVVRVKPVLEDFAARIHELLAEWPRHPALMQVRPLYLFVLRYNHKHKEWCPITFLNIKKGVEHLT